MKLESIMDLVTSMNLVLILMISHQFFLSVKSFNIDTSSTQVLEGENASLFGYSVAMWIDANEVERLVVGAPRGTQALAANQTYILGNVYMCQPMSNTTQNQCDVRNDIPRLSEADYSLQAVQWAKHVYKTQGIGFGETVFAPRRNKSKLVVCAPRFPRKNVNVRGSEFQLQSRGGCFTLSSQSQEKKEPKLALAYPHYWLDNDKKVKKICLRNDDKCNGFALAGFSATMNNDGSTLYLGSPAGFKSQGVTLSMRLKQGEWTRTKTTKVRRRGQNDTQTEVHKDDKKNYDDNMEGFATILGRFKRYKDLIATSSPGYDFSRGMVRLYDSSLKKFELEVFGTEIGAVYGYSLAGADFDRDNIDDLVVGAPFSLDDAGKVFIYHSPCEKTGYNLELEGSNHYDRFGQALATPGDLDMDGYNDLVVGAPNSFKGSGSIFIYNGSPKGIQVKPSQVIHAKDFPFKLSWFGFSIAGGHDFDGNGYPDLAVGSPASDKALFLRSGPVVMLTGDIQFESSSIRMDEASRDIIVLNGIEQKVISFELIIILQYKATHISDPLAFRFKIKLDNSRQRLAFWDNHDHVYNTIHNVSHVTSPPHPLRLKVFVKPNVRHLKLEENAVATLEVSLHQDKQQELQSNVDEEHNPNLSTSYAKLLNVISTYSNTTFSSEISFQCPDIQLCISQTNLSLKSIDIEPLIVADGTRDIMINLGVQNNSAYSVKLNMTAPSSMMFIRAHSDNHFPHCALLSSAELFNRYICNFSSELPKDSQIKLTLNFKYNSSELLHYGNSTLDFDFEVSSDTNDLDQSDNSLQLFIPLVSKVDIQASNWSNPDTADGIVEDVLSFNYFLGPDYGKNTSDHDSSDITFRDLGPEISHHYILVNKGPSPLLTAKVVIGIPLFLPNKLPLLYLAKDLKTSTNLKCQSPIINPFNFSRFSESEVSNSSSEIDELKDNSTENENGDSIPFNTSHTSLTEEDLVEFISEYRGEEDDKDDLIKGEETDTATQGSKADERGYLKVNNKLREKRSLPIELGQSESVDSSWNGTSSSSVNKEHQRKDSPSERNNRKKKQPLQLDCNILQCEEIMCELRDLMVNDRATIEVNAFVTVGSLQTLPTSSVIIESSLAFYTEQKNVNMNKQPAQNDPSHISKPTVKSNEDDKHISDYIYESNEEADYEDFNATVRINLNENHTLILTGDQNENATDYVNESSENTDFIDVDFNHTDIIKDLAVNKTHENIKHFDDRTIVTSSSVEMGFSTEGEMPFTSISGSTITIDAGNDLKSTTKTLYSFDDSLPITKEPISEITSIPTPRDNISTTLTYEGDFIESILDDSGNVSFAVIREHINASNISTVNENTSDAELSLEVNSMASNLLLNKSLHENSITESLTNSPTSTMDKEVESFTDANKLSSTWDYRNNSWEGTTETFLSSGSRSPDVKSTTPIHIEHFPNDEHRALALIIEPDTGTNSSPTDRSEYHTKDRMQIFPNGSSTTHFGGNRSKAQTDGNLLQYPIDKEELYAKSLNNQSKRKYDLSANTQIIIIKKNNKADNGIPSLFDVGFLNLILAVMAALMIIIIVIAILYKIGFFKRDRISDEQRERLAQSIKKRIEHSNGAYELREKK